MYVGVAPSIVGSYSSTKWLWMSWMVKHDFPTPPPPTTTSLYSRRNCSGGVSLAMIFEKRKISTRDEPPLKPSWRAGSQDPTRPGSNLVKGQIFQKRASGAEPNGEHCRVGATATEERLAGGSVAGSGSKRGGSVLRGRSMPDGSIGGEEERKANQR